MARKRRLVSLRVDERFFDNIFEKERMRMERIKGIRLSQRSFTEILFKANAKFKIPKQKKVVIGRIVRRKR